MTDLQPLVSYATVQAWLEGLRQHWGGEPERDDPERFEILEAFCRFVDKNPDAIVEECVRVRDGERTVSTKGRRRYADLIAQFQSQAAGSRLRRAKWGNTVRSFLIHNGILLQAGPQAGVEEPRT